MVTGESHEERACPSGPAGGQAGRPAGCDQFRHSTAPSGPVAAPRAGAKAERKLAYLR